MKNPILSNGEQEAKAFILDLFESKGGESPASVATIAGQLSLNGLELYTETERFIFELIQNADDMPADGQKEVDVTFKMTDNYFIFMHDGKAFTKRDVDAISDAANSNKREDSLKTGYKGIGFKSVFTDAESVFVHSGGFSFKYDKNAEIYKSFESLYAPYFNGLVEAKRVREREKYQSKEKDYENIDKISWQIKPIWVDKAEYSEEIISDDFFSSPVSIALYIGKDKLIANKYETKVEKLFKEPRFLLFLRHIQRISVELNNKLIEVEKLDSSTFSTLLSDDDSHRYTTKSYPINIDEKSFREANLSMMLSESNDGKRILLADNGAEIKNIPSKLLQLINTKLTFAAEVDDEANIIKVKDSILFNYLPTTDKNYQFPFLVNGDFITQTNREFVLKDNYWNHYLFYYIGYYHLKWIADLSDTVSIKSYLNVLVEQLTLRNDADTYADIKKAFDEGFKKGIQEIAFIKTSQHGLKKAAEIIIDETDISIHLGEDFFYKLTETDKHLVHPDLNADKIAKKDFNPDKLSYHKLSVLLTKENGRNLLRKELAAITSEKYLDFLQKINDKHIKHESFKTIINDIPILKFGENIFSVKEILEKPNHILLSKNSALIRKELSKLYIVSDINISDYPEIKKQLSDNVPSYFQLAELKKVIETKTSIKNDLTKEERSIIFKHLESLKVGNLGNFKIFQNEVGTIMPLKNMIAPTHPNWLSHYKIGDEIIKDLDKYLVAEKEIYQKIIYKDWASIIENESIHKANIQDFYKEVIAYYDEDTSPLKPKLKDVTTHEIYFNIEGDFVPRSEIFYNSVLEKLSEEEYVLLNQVINKITIPDDTTDEPINGKKCIDYSLLKVIDNELFKPSNDRFNENIKRIENLAKELSVQQKMLLFGIDSFSITKCRIFYSATEKETKTYCYLDSLIQKSTNLPIWLNDYTIHSDFDLYTDKLVQNMMKSSDIYEQVILEEWTNISEKVNEFVKQGNLKITDFYESVTYYFNDNPENKDRRKDKLSTRDAACIYNTEVGFLTYDETFYNEHVEGLKDFVNTLTGLDLPESSILSFLTQEIVLEKLNSPFYHKVFSKNLLENFSKSTFELGQEGALALIHFASKNNSEKIFDLGYFDSQYNFIVSSDIKQYYVEPNQEDKKAYINKHFSDKLILLPASLPTDKTPIGLLAKSSLNTFLLGQVQAGTEEYLDIIDIIHKDRSEATKLFLSKITTANPLKIYASPNEEECKANEFSKKYLQLYINTYREQEKSIEYFSNIKEAIKIDEFTLTEIKVKGDLEFDNCIIKYNDVLPDSKDMTYLISTVRDLFSDENINKFILNTPDEDLEETYKHFKGKYKGQKINNSQFAFVLNHLPEELSDYQHPTKLEIIKHYFDQQWKVSDGLIKYIDWDNSEIIYPSHYALPVELLEQQYQDWIGEDEDKIAFVERLGVHTPTSEIVLLRQFLAENAPVEQAGIIVAKLSSKQDLLKRTIQWLSIQNVIYNEVIDKKRLVVIKEIYQKIPKLDKFPFLFITACNQEGELIYEIKAAEGKNIYTGLGNFPNHKGRIIEIILGSKDNQILDETFKNPAWGRLNGETFISLNEVLDTTNLSYELWGEGYYQWWKEQTGIDVFLQDAPIRFKETLLGQEVRLLERTKSVYIEKTKCYAQKNASDNIMTNLKEVLEEKDFKCLEASKKAINLLTQLLNRNNQDFDDTIQELKVYPFLIHQIIENLSTAKIEVIWFQLSQIQKLYQSLNLIPSSLPLLCVDYLNDKEVLSFQLRSTNKKYYYGIDRADAEYKPKISSIIKQHSGEILKFECTKNEKLDANIEIEDKLDDDKLIKNAFELPVDHFYHRWNKKATIKVLAYESQMPYKKEFLGKSIEGYVKDNFLPHEGIFYINIEHKDSLDAHLKEHISSEDYQDLLSCKNSGNAEKIRQLEAENADLKRNQTRQNREHQSPYNKEQSNLIKEEMRQLGINIDAEGQIAINKSAMIFAWKKLSVDSYDVSKAKFGDSVITNITNPDGEPIKVIVRSAKNGLLFLNPYTWDQLSRNNVLLMVQTGSSWQDFAICDSTTQVLERFAQDLRYTIFRVQNSKDPQITNQQFSDIADNANIGHFIFSTGKNDNFRSLYGQLDNTHSEEFAEAGYAADDDFEF